MATKPQIPSLDDVPTSSRRSFLGALSVITSRYFTGVAQKKPQGGNVSAAAAKSSKKDAAPPQQQEIDILPLYPFPLLLHLATLLKLDDPKNDVASFLPLVLSSSSRSKTRVDGSSFTSSSLLADSFISALSPRDATFLLVYSVAALHLVVDSSSSSSSSSSSAGILLPPSPTNVSSLSDARTAAAFRQIARLVVVNCLQRQPLALLLSLQDEAPATPSSFLPSFYPPYLLSLIPHLLSTSDSSASPSASSSSSSSPSSLSNNLSSSNSGTSMTYGRMFLLGGATLLGATAVGLTGGLAAPAVALTLGSLLTGLSTAVGVGGAALAVTGSAVAGIGTGAVVVGVAAGAGAAVGGVNVGTRVGKRMGIEGWEFAIVQHYVKGTGDGHDEDEEEDELPPDEHIHEVKRRKRGKVWEAGGGATILVSGWLRDIHDCERVWGIDLNNSNFIGGGGNSGNKEDEGQNVEDEEEGKDSDGTAADDNAEAAAEMETQPLKKKTTRLSWKEKIVGKSAGAATATATAAPPAALAKQPTVPLLLPAPPLAELLERFYIVTNPQKLSNVPEIAAKWTNHEKELVNHLRTKYRGFGLVARIDGSALEAGGRGLFPLPVDLDVTSGHPSQELSGGILSSIAESLPTISLSSSGTGTAATSKPAATATTAAKTTTATAAAATATANTATAATETKPAAASGKVPAAYKTVPIFDVVQDKAEAIQYLQREWISDCLRGMGIRVSQKQQQQQQPKASDLLKRSEAKGGKHSKTTNDLLGMNHPHPPARSLSAAGKEAFDMLTSSASDLAWMDAGEEPKAKKNESSVAEGKSPKLSPKLSPSQAPPPTPELVRSISAPRGPFYPIRLRPIVPSTKTPLYDFSAAFPPTAELYTLRFDPPHYIALTESVSKLLSEIASSAVQKVLEHTVMAGLLAAAALPVTVWGAFKAIDGDWTIACERADEAGVKLARALVAGGSGRRGGVRLLGFSFGARLILSCLKELTRLQTEWEEGKSSGGIGGVGVGGGGGDGGKAKDGRVMYIDASIGSGSGSVASSSSSSGEVDDGDDSKLGSKLGSKPGSKPGSRASTPPRVPAAASSSALPYTISLEPASVVSCVVIIGTPSHLKPERFTQYKKVVAGRFVNCYCSHDYVLSMLFNYRRMTASLAAAANSGGRFLGKGVVGCSPVGVEGVEDFDVGELVAQHDDYANKIPDILERIGFGAERE